MVLVFGVLMTYWLLAMMFSFRLGYSFLKYSSFFPYIFVILTGISILTVLYIWLGFLQLKRKKNLCKFEIPYFFLRDRISHVMYICILFEYNFGNNWLMSYTERSWFIIILSVIPLSSIVGCFCSWYFMKRFNFVNSGILPDSLSLKSEYLPIQVSFPLGEMERSYVESPWGSIGVKIRGNIDLISSDKYSVNSVKFFLMRKRIEAEEMNKAHLAFLNVMEQIDFYFNIDNKTVTLVSDDFPEQTLPIVSLVNGCVKTEEKVLDKCEVELPSIEGIVNGFHYFGNDITYELKMIHQPN